jgi:hypothetical protein
MAGRGRDDHPSRHCEARSAVAIHVPADLPPTSRTSIKFVKSVNQENDGHEEEQIYR